jgi:hypothetical protein
LFAASVIYAKAADQSPGEKLRIERIVLHDQFDDKHEIAFPRDKAVLFVLADRKGSEHVEPWVRAVYDRYEDSIDIEGIAAVTGVPKVLRGVVRTIFKEGLDEKPILLDWDGDVCGRFGYEGGDVEVHLVNPDGVRTFSVRGPHTAERFDSLCDALDSIEQVRERR